MIKSKKILENSSAYITNNIINIKEEGKRKEVKFGLQLLISFIFNVILMILISSFFDVLWLTLTAGFSAGIFKKYSGGVHAKTPFKCALISSVIFTACGLIAKNFNLNYFMFVWSLIIIGGLIIYFYAPNDTVEKVILNKEKEVELKIKSFLAFTIILFSGFIINMLYPNNNFALAILLGLSWQLLAITPIAYTVFLRK
mgnify:CR=1 FL=1